MRIPLPKLAAQAVAAVLLIAHGSVELAAREIGKHALVIYNSHYANLSRLPEAETDGRKVADALRGADATGFQVSSHANARTKADFEAHWKGYLAKLDVVAARRERHGEAISVVYFSGHGAEVEHDSFLIATGMPAEPSDVQITSQGVSLRRLFADFRDRQKKWEDQGLKVHGVFVIDACRTRPPEAPSAAVVASSFRTKSSALESKPGSVPIAPPAGIFVMYAASAGQYAHTSLGNEEGPGPHPSVFTGRLLRLLKEPLSLQNMARRVRWLVHRDVAMSKPPAQRQTPAYFDELQLDMTFHGSSPGETEESGDSPERLTTRPAPGHEVWECPECPHLVVVPRPHDDVFLMGSPRTEAGNNPAEEGTLGEGEDRRLAVSLTETYAIGISEVTIGEIRPFLAMRCRTEPGPQCVFSPQGAELPATGVTWATANAYTEWLNTSLKLDKSAASSTGFYRLPTEAEWEYAARGDAIGPYVHGDELSKLCQFGNGADQSLRALFMANNTCDDRRGRNVAQAKSYKPNGFGLYDVHGNAWEWVADCWSDSLIDAKRNGAAPFDQPDCKDRVAKGGSWLSAPEALRLAKRGRFDAIVSRPTLGFRVVRVLPKLTTGQADAPRIEARLPVTPAGAAPN